MKIMSKYYTPDISEFYFGFEYEMKEHFGDGTVKTQEDYDKAQWIKRITGSLDSPYIERMLFGKNAENGLCGIRVKYLDSSDIESLGFEYGHIKPDEDEYPDEDFILGYTKEIKEDTNKGWYRMYLSKDGKWIIEYWYYRNSVCQIGSTLFKGEIKNKSKLIEVLKMIGVNYE